MHEAYYAYLEGCRQFNQHELPEEGWDEHHILPQCLFHGHGPTIWLSPEQHAVASVLQSYAFQRVCVTGWMKKHLPEKWVPYWRAWRREAQRHRSLSIPVEERGVGVKQYWASLTPEQKTERARRSNEGRNHTLRAVKGGEVFVFESTREMASGLGLSLKSVWKLKTGQREEVSGVRLLGH